MRIAINRTIQMLFIGLVVLVIQGCAAGYRTSTRNGHESVYRVDKEGNKTLVYEVDKAGSITIHDETDPRAQQVMATQERLEQAKIDEIQRVERIQQAPKRSDNDPIRVALHAMELAPELEKAQHSEGAVADSYLKEFKGDRIIHLVSGGGGTVSELNEISKILSGRSAKTGPASDVEVFSKGYLEKKAGYNTKTKKLGEMVVVVFEATISSNYAPASYTVTEEGNVFRNDVVMKRFVEKIKAAIVNQVGPTIPADRSM